MDYIPQNSTDIHIFSIKENSEKQLEAYVGFTLENGNFMFIQIPIKIQK
jgi:hypothetical protein